MSRIVTVFGATGTQGESESTSTPSSNALLAPSHANIPKTPIPGSSVITALLADPHATFTPRAVTRNIHSDRAKELRARGVQVVRGDLSDGESVRRVVGGSECVFGVTNTADIAGLAGGKGLEFEVEQGKNLVDACKEVGVKFFVWSSLPSISKLSNGKYNHVAPFENKAIIDEYLRTSGVPYAILHTAGFAENIYNQYLQKVSTPSGPAYEMVLLRTPRTATLPIVWIGRDLGRSVLVLLENYRDEREGEGVNDHHEHEGEGGENYRDELGEGEGKETGKGRGKDTGIRILGQTFTVVSEQIGVEEIIGIVEEAIGHPITFRELETSGMVEIDELFDFFKEFNYTSTMKVDPRLVALGVRPSTMREFAEVELRMRYA